MSRLRSWLADRWPPADARVAAAVRERLWGLPSFDEPLVRALELGVPCLIGRLGGTESRVIGAWLRRFDPDARRELNRWLWPGPYGKRAQQLQNLSGVYPVQRADIDAFVHLYMDAMASVDVLGVWGRPFTWPEGIPMRDPAVEITHIEAVAPWIESWDAVLRGSSGKTPWSTGLNGRRVLVVSPFAQSIQRQFERIGRVFPGTQSHGFELTALRAPMTLGGGPDGSTWHDQLNQLQDEIRNTPHDVALVSAGAYSLPAAAASKEAGAIGVHCGGSLQLFFGVMGARWETNPNVSRFVNESWVRPSPSETPKNAFAVEGGCYW